MSSPIASLSAGLVLLAGSSAAGVSDSPDALSALATHFSESISRFDESLSWHASLESTDYHQKSVSDIPSVSDSMVLEMKPLIVSGEKLIELDEKHDDAIQAFVRTGTLAQHVGRRVTTRLWIKGDKGVMISFSW